MNIRVRVDVAVHMVKVILVRQISMIGMCRCVGVREVAVRGVVVVGMIEVLRTGRLCERRRNVHREDERRDPAGLQQRAARKFLPSLCDFGILGALFGRLILPDIVHLGLPERKTISHRNQSEP